MKKIVHRNKRQITTYFPPYVIEAIDEFCKEANLKRTNFLAIAALHYIKSIKEKHDLLPYAYNAYSDTNWTKNMADEFLSGIWDVYLHDNPEIAKEVLLELGIPECLEYRDMITAYGFEGVCQILIGCITKEVGTRTRQHLFK